jgi:predicted transposase/invertase (TIGR01784 family)
MTALTEDDPRIIEAHREFRRFTSDPKARELARQRHLFLVDYHLGMDASRAEGKAEEKLEVASKLKRRGMDCETIIDITGLSRDEVERLN